MAKVQKIVGEFPENVRVADELVRFDANGEADVSDAVALVLAHIPHEYHIVGDVPEALKSDPLYPLNVALGTVVEDAPAAEDVTGEGGDANAKASEVEPEAVSEAPAAVAEPAQAAEAPVVEAPAPAAPKRTAPPRRTAPAAPQA